MAVNAAWHRRHPMPSHPSKEDRIAWHEEHAAQCGCREMPAEIRKELARRKKVATKD